MTREPLANELAQRLSVLIGMIMEDEVDEAITVSAAGAAPLMVRIGELRSAGDDIVKLAAAAEVALRRYGRTGLGQAEGERE